MRRRSVRITPLGYIVLALIILVMLVSIYFIVWSMRGSGDKTAESTTSPSGEYTPTPSLVPVSDATTPPTAKLPWVCNTMLSAPCGAAQALRTAASANGRSFFMVFLVDSKSGRVSPSR